MKKIIILGIILLASFTAIYLIKNYNKRSSTPPLLTKNFVDPAKVEKISKFRSCQGHTVIPTDESETKRNMKHYVLLKEEFRGSNKVQLFAPYDAKIGLFSNPEKGLEGEIWFDAGSDWQFSIEHIIINPKLSDGDSVKAGDFIGYSGPKGFDIVYAVGAETQKIIDGYNSPFAKLDSVFTHMTDDLFTEYQKFGIKNKQDMEYSKEYRDSNPCKYRDNQGGLNDFDHPEDWVQLK